MSDHRTLMRQVTKEAVMAQVQRVAARGRWAKLCQTCWQTFWPDQYCPELTGDDDCSECGQYALVVSVNPKDIEAVKDFAKDRHPSEIYGTPEHEAWLIEMERQEG